MALRAFASQAATALRISSRPLLLRHFSSKWSVHDDLSEGTFLYGGGAAFHQRLSTPYKDSWLGVYDDASVCKLDGHVLQLVQPIYVAETKQP